MPEHEFELLSPPDQPQVSLKFRGRRQDPEFRWHATFLALANDSHRGQRAFIDIGDTIHNETMLTVGIRVPVIDKSTILKTITMIRNYKGLHPGRHEYGEPV